MSRYKYNTAFPPPKAYEVVDKAVARIKAQALVVSGTFYLASTSDVYAHEEPVPKPARWVLVSKREQLGGEAVDDSGVMRVQLHVKVVGEREMTTWPTWHAAMHDRIAESLTNHLPVFTYATASVGYRQITEPSRPEYFEDTDTRESFALYAINVGSLQP